MLKKNYTTSIWTLVKSVLVIGYLFLIFSAGLLRLGGYRYTYFFYPWAGWHMFASNPSTHVQITAFGFRKDGSMEEINFAIFFPMPRLLIERGSLYALSNIWGQYSKAALKKESASLCRFLLTKANKNIVDFDQKFEAMEVKKRSWPLDKGKKAATETILAKCLVR